MPCSRQRDSECLFLTRRGARPARLAKVPVGDVSEQRPLSRLPFRLTKRGRLVKTSPTRGVRCGRGGAQREVNSRVGVERGCVEHWDPYLA